MVCSCRTGFENLPLKFAGKRSPRVNVVVLRTKCKLKLQTLMAWFAIYCLNLMISPSEGSDRPPFLEQYEKCDWRNYFIHVICRTVHSHYHSTAISRILQVTTMVKNSGTPRTWSLYDTAFKLLLVVNQYPTRTPTILARIHLLSWAISSK